MLKPGKDDALKIMECLKVIQIIEDYGRRGERYRFSVDVHVAEVF